MLPNLATCLYDHKPCSYRLCDYSHAPKSITIPLRPPPMLLNLSPRLYHHLHALNNRALYDQVQYMLHDHSPAILNTQFTLVSICSPSIHSNPQPCPYLRIRPQHPRQHLLTHPKSHHLPRLSAPYTATPLHHPLAHSPRPNTYLSVLILIPIT